MAMKQVKFKPFPPNTEAPEDLSAKTQTIELFQAGDKLPPLTSTTLHCTGGWRSAGGYH